MDAHKNAKRLPFTSFLYPVWEFGARKCYTDHRTSYTIHGFGDSVLVCKVHDCYCRYEKSLSKMSFLPIQATQAIIMVRLDENKPLQNAFKRI